MAEKKTTTAKTEVSASVLKAALKAMQTLKINEVHVTPDGYIFSKERDVRSYVGKDGEYKTLTKADCMPKDTKAPAPPKADKGKTETKGEAKAESVKNEGQGGSADPVIDEHKKQE